MQLNCQGRFCPYPLFARLLARESFLESFPRPRNARTASPVSAALPILRTPRGARLAEACSPEERERDIIMDVEEAFYVNSTPGAHSCSWTPCYHDSHAASGAGRFARWPSCTNNSDHHHIVSSVHNVSTAAHYGDPPLVRAETNSSRMDLAPPLRWPRTD